MDSGLFCPVIEAHVVSRDWTIFCRMTDVLNMVSLWDFSLHIFKVQISYKSCSNLGELKPLIWKTGSTSSICIGCSNNNTAANSRLSKWGFKRTWVYDVAFVIRNTACLCS